MPDYIIHLKPFTLNLLRMLKNILLVGLGGAAGSMLRYLFSVWFKHASFPIATFLVNIIGSFIIGAVFAVALRSEAFANNWRLFLAAGICGGFTTFSAFSYESFLLFQADLWQMAVLYAVLSLIGCLLAVCLGYKASQIFV